MQKNTLKELKKELVNLYRIYKKLVINWNGSLIHGNNSTYPITIIVEVLLNNLCFDSSDSFNYNLDTSISKLYSDLEMLKELNDYNNKGYMTHFPYTECKSIIDGYVMSEDESNLDLKDESNYMVFDD